MKRFNFSYLAFLPLLIWFIYFRNIPNLFWAYLFLSVICFLILRYAISREKFKSRDKTPLFFILGYVIIFMFLAAIKYRHFGIVSGDLATYDQAFWTATKGKLFYFSFTGGGSWFKMHNDLFMFFVLPFYFVYPSAHTLYFLLIVTIGISSYVLYLIANRYLNKSASLLVALSYLFYPGIVGQRTWCFHIMPFTTVFVLLAFYFFEKDDFPKFIIFLVLSLSVTEYVAATVVMFSIYAVIKRKGKVWILWPLVLSTISAVASSLIITQQTFRIKWLFFLLGHPLQLLRFVGLKYKYLIDTFAPLWVVLPFLGSAIIFILPSLGVNLLLTEIGRTAIFMHTTVLVGVFLFVALVQSLNKITKKFKLGERFVNSITVLIFFSIISFFPLWLYPQSYLPHPKQVTVQKILKFIPPDASVTTPRYIASHLAHRNEMYFYDNRRHSDYVILDITAGWEVNQFRDYFVEIMKSPDYVLIFQEKKIFLFKKLKYDN